MGQSHDPPSEIKDNYEHVMKDFDEQYDSVGQTSKSRDNRMNTPTFTIISCTLTPPNLITSTLAH
jgi:Mg2+ and Co2+ transporter CorA